MSSLPDEVLAGSGPIPLVALVAIGLVICFHGRPLFGFVLALLGFLVAWRLSETLLIGLQAGPALVRWGSLGIGALVALVSGFLFRSCLFMAGSVVGWFLVGGWFPASSLLLHVAGAFFCGLLLFLCSDVLIAVLTSLAGALLAARGAMGLLSLLDFRPPDLALLGASLLLAAAGAARQLRKKG
ncbi:hypothetical protein JW921_11440 [Candidatus Fermentibacterales bacterium]|nr:hypothetical protein [Candidatus Fermentibacterales bacterium]